MCLRLFEYQLLKSKLVSPKAELSLLWRAQVVQWDELGRAEAKKLRQGE